MGMTTSTFHCDYCQQDVTVDHYEFTTGYGRDRDDKKICYECCAKQDAAYMLEKGEITLYLSKDDRSNWMITNWPASLKFPVITLWHGRHNLAHRITFVRFFGPDGKVWSGKQVGEFTELCHCKATKIMKGDIYNYS